MGKKENWKVKEQVGRGWSNVGTAQPLKSISRNFRLIGIKLDDTHYQLTPLYQYPWKSPLSIQGWERLEGRYYKYPHKFWMATVWRIHILTHNLVLRVSSSSKNAMTSYGFSPCHETFPSKRDQQPVFRGTCDMIGCSWHHLLVSGTSCH